MEPQTAPQNGHDNRAARVAMLRTGLASAELARKQLADLAGQRRSADHGAVAMKVTVTLAVACIASLLLAAVLVMADPDVDGMRGLASPGAAVAVVGLSVLPVVLMGIVLSIGSRFGARWGLVALVSLASAFSILVLMSTQPALSSPAKLDILTRSTLFTAGALALGTLPYWLTSLRRSAGP